MNAKNQKASSGKSQQHMSDETFRELKESFEEALAHARGKKTKSRVTRIQIPTQSPTAKTSRVPIQLSTRRRSNVVNSRRKAS